jgi:hypothetical protein|tara:strand:+ start:9270 stop:9476 length:207 start_codon:yes stop_codon:yes gene_type:complete
MWKLYKYNGHYIQGELLSKHSSEEAALKKAKKEIKHTHTEKVKQNKEIIIWLDDKNHNPVGMIVKKTR